MKEVINEVEEDETPTETAISDITVNRPMFWTLMAYVIFVVALIIQMFLHWLLRRCCCRSRNQTPLKQKTGIPTRQKNMANKEVLEKAPLVFEE